MYWLGNISILLALKELWRSYSVANLVSANEIELHIKKVPGGVFSDYWFGGAQVNDLLRFHGPVGTFFLRDVPDKDIIFFATGTGIAPIKAMLEGLEASPLKATHRSVTLFWGRTQEDLYLDVASIFRDIHYVPVLSRALGWSGERGHVQEACTREG